MAKTKSVLKRIRQAEKRRLRNKSYRSYIKTLTKKFVREDNPDRKKVLLNQLYSALDKAVQKGIFHKNTAARRKSKAARIMYTFVRSRGE